MTEREARERETVDIGSRCIYGEARVGVAESATPTVNAARMRAALEAVIKVGYPHNFQREAPHIRDYCYDITRAIKKCFAALSAPPRNCDIDLPRLGMKGGAR